MSNIAELRPKLQVRHRYYNNVQTTTARERINNSDRQRSQQEPATIPTTRCNYPCQEIPGQPVVSGSWREESGANTPCLPLGIPTCTAGRESLEEGATSVRLSKVTKKRHPTAYTFKKLSNLTHLASYCNLASRSSWLFKAVRLDKSRAVLHRNYAVQLSMDDPCDAGALPELCRSCQSPLAPFERRIRVSGCSYPQPRTSP